MSFLIRRCLFLMLAVSQLQALPTFAADGGIEEVVVTAQRREQSVNDVSITMTALTSEDIAAFRINDPTDLANIVTNTDIKTTTGSGNPAITIRGIGLNSFEANTNGAVGVYTDDVYLGSPALNMNMMFDVDRVEILKGPQGTLYGRNTTAGALNIINKKPTQEVDAYVMAGFANYDTTEVEAGIGGGLSDNVAGRLSFRYQNNGESHLENILSGKDFGEIENIGARAQLLFSNASDTIRTHISVHYQSMDGTVLNAPTFEAALDPANPFNPDFSVNLCAPALAAGAGNNQQCVDVFGYPDPLAFPFLGPLQQGADDHEFVVSDTAMALLDNQVDLVGGNVRVDWDVTDTIGLVSITGVEAMERDWGELGIAHPLTIFNLTHDEEINSFSQEFRLLGSAERLNWIAGAYYSRDTFESTNIALLDDLFLTRLSYINDQEVTAFAVFGNVDFQLSEKNTLIFGLRYSDENVDFKSDTVDVNPFDASCLLDLFCGPTGFGAVPLATVNDDLSESNVSFKLALEHRPNDDLLIYGSVTSGFKSGGFPGGIGFADSELQSFDSEDLLAIELGMKATLADGRVQINASVYLYDWEDIQTLVPSLLDTTIGNADGAEMIGAEFEIIAQPTKNLMFLVGLSYQDSELDNIGLVPKGNELPNAPKQQALALARYELPIADNYLFSIQGNVKYTDEMFRDALNDRLNKVDAYTVADARLSFSEVSGRWEVSLWAENIFDEIYEGDRFNLVDTVGAVASYLGMPRTYGVTVTFRPAMN